MEIQYISHAGKVKSAVLIGTATKTVFASLIEFLDLATWKEVIPNG